MKSIAQMCREAGIDRKTYYNRLKQNKKDLFKSGKYRKVSDEVRQLLKEHGVSMHVYYNRLYRGWTEFEAANVPLMKAVYYYKGKPFIQQVSSSRYNRLFRLVEEGWDMDKAMEYLIKLQEKDNEQRV